MTPEEAQTRHEQRQDSDDDHDLSSCHCCCIDCEIEEMETVDGLYAALPESEWVITRGMLIKRIGDPPTEQDIEDFRHITQTLGQGLVVHPATARD